MRSCRAKLEAEGAAPSPEADRRTLIRRVTFDLIGLPPTPEEVEAFVADAVARRLRDGWSTACSPRPRYGERWARHWMDVVHFAETHGHDQDRARPNAWPYRDYLIRSFNDDKPYARFVEEQIAGDVLYPRRPAGDRRARASSPPGRGTRARRCDIRDDTRRQADRPATSTATTWSRRSCPRSPARPSTAPAATTTSSTRSRRRSTTASRPSSPASTGPTGPTTPTPRSTAPPATLTRAASRPRDRDAGRRWPRCSTPATQARGRRPGRRGAARASRLDGRSTRATSRPPSGATLDAAARRLGPRRRARGRTKDTYTLTAATDLKRITADPPRGAHRRRLPQHGPGPAATTATCT